MGRMTTRPTKFILRFRPSELYSSEVKAGKLFAESLIPDSPAALITCDVKRAYALRLSNKLKIPKCAAGRHAQLLYDTN
jgi:hypothetical protein